MRYCQDCAHYSACKRQGTDIPDHIIEKHKRDVIEILCRDFEDRQKHGRWIETEEGTVCSECHKHPFEDGEFAIANYNGNFCPNCGTKMDLPNITDQAQAALEAMGKKVHAEEGL